MDQRSIVVVESSPRKAGNSSLLARRLIEGAGSAGARVEEFALRGLKVGPCIACDSCRRPGARGCVVPDDMQAIYAAIRAAEAVVLASPVYWFSVNAQLKALIDRLYAFGAEKYAALAGKRFAAILVFGDRDIYESGGINAVRSVEDMCRFLGAARPEFLYGSADKAGEIAGNAELMARAYELGKRLASE
ncbi:MAG TPA: flavodoxin family protein [Spirochaetales bacterium]|nr:flavodoxin family protein [Spirochaetales bacterium]HRY55983.1 flavodoxin family protein [Spirochaetia bacterium]